MKSTFRPTSFANEDLKVSEFHRDTDKAMEVLNGPLTRLQETMAPLAKLHEGMTPPEKLREPFEKLHATFAAYSSPFKVMADHLAMLRGPCLDSGLSSLLRQESAIAKLQKESRAISACMRDAAVSLAPMDGAMAQFMSAEALTAKGLRELSDHAAAFFSPQLELGMSSAFARDNEALRQFRSHDAITQVRHAFLKESEDALKLILPTKRHGAAPGGLGLLTEDDPGPLIRSKPAQPPFAHDETFQHLIVNGCAMTLGPTAARVVKLLHEAAQTGSGWRSGKQVLAQAGSRQSKMHDLFKLTKNWTDVIESDSRGQYRLRFR